jgi:glycosyltransferase involved in cell wall biosynthesis
MTENQSVFIYGGEGLDSSIDADRKNVEALLGEAGFRITRNPLVADVIHFVWWDQVYKFRHLRRFSKAKWLATVTNTIDVENERFRQLKSTVDIWVAANLNQFDWLKHRGVKVAYQPFFVDEAIFRPLKITRESLCSELGVDIKDVTGKVLVGSFQRDTTADLMSPKWQKGPDFLVQMLRSIDIQDKNWCLVLAGPRRHWIIEQCKLLDIPYIFVGDPPKSGVDDISYNTLDAETIAKLYNFIDIYVVSSEREGGPKAVMESILCGTPLISRPIGLAPDMMCDIGLYSTVVDGAQLLSRLISDISLRKVIACCHSKIAAPILGRSNTIERWIDIYSRIFNKLQ